MNARPVIERELRVQSRNQSTYWLRVASALIGTGVFGVIMIHQRQAPAILSTRLFATMHVVLLAAIWLLGPALTADCLSREKREGTLGLLVLTSLNTPTIVASKALVHIVRGATFWMVSLPILVMPLLLGGVTWIDLASAFALEFCALLLALASGLLASSLTGMAARGYWLGELIALFCAGLMALLLTLSFLRLARIPAPLTSTLKEYVGITAFLNTGMFTADLSGWSRLLSGVPGGRGISAWLAALGLGCLFAVLFFLLAIAFAAWRLGRSWRDEPPSARAIQRRRKWFAPRFLVPAFRRAMQRKLDRNPIAWLQEHSVGKRLSKWVLLGVLLLVEMPFGLGDGDSRQAGFQIELIVGLLLSLAFVSAQSFQQERQIGTWELLLVSPLSPWQIVRGRLSGIGAMFLPAVLVSFLFLPGPEPSEFGVGPIGLPQLLAFSSFLAVPLTGLYLSLRLSNFLVTWLATFAFAVLWPVVLLSLIQAGVYLLRERYHFDCEWLWPSGREGPHALVLFWLAQSAVALVCGILLYRGLAKRTLGVASYCR